ncbi:TPA: hypothetical protein R2K43_000786 [Raoultella planticola]|uniref:HNH endonuclease n=1 Tax=Raoultella planticola TaxID=575 RepID=UPI000BA0150E|nr:HNH endonuclease [Raoultella planticola]OZP70399.1 hypothetical protein CIG23_29065 [Raoultella planticola]HEC2625629.1 hypothetical protein [Raoultella planticola]
MNNLLYLKMVIFSDQSLSFIKKYDLKDDKIWEQKSNEMIGLKKEIKSHCKFQQYKKCIYCRINQISEYDQVWDVEHIMPKNDFPQFLFHPLNIALSCKQCNRAKFHKSVLNGVVNKEIKEYPMNGMDFIIIHPYLDRYSAHMKVEEMGGKYLYTPLSKKGLKTYDMCNLKRFAISHLINMDESEKAYQIISSVFDLIKEYGHSHSESNLTCKQIEGMKQFVNSKAETIYTILSTDFRNE